MPPAMNPTMPNLTANPLDFPETIIISLRLFMQKISESIKRKRDFFFTTSISIIFL
jgi:hypothetical protein